MSLKTIGQAQQMIKNDMNVERWTNRVERDLEQGLPLSLQEGQNGADRKTFGDFLANSLSDVNKLQVDANAAMQKLASGESKNIHETLLAVEKADIAFRTMNQVRTKVLDAYREIMRMQV
jgi:flagellar hook-basal body complex protein FliE